MFKRVPPHVLHLYAGRERPDGLPHYLARYGWGCTEVDILRQGVDMDLLSDAAWERWGEKIDDRVVGHVHLGTPCSTWGEAREHPGGPPVLRSTEHPTGLPGLGPKEREEVRKTIVHLLRAVDACRRIHAVGGGFSWEQPEPK